MARITTQEAPSGATEDVVTYLHADHLGSAQTGTRSNGTLAWRQRYTPFGEAITNLAANDNLAGFTGHIKDKATGLNRCIFRKRKLHEMQARYYDPVIGRFLSIDPVTFMSTGDPRYFNRYAYAANDPVNMIDPDGQAFGVASKVVKVAIKGDDIGSVLAGGIEDAKTLTGRNVSLGRRLAAGASLATEIFSPVSARDAKAITAGASKALSGRKADLGPPAPNRSTLFPGPHAGDSIPASSTGKAKAAEQRQVNDIMSDTGCHTCRTKNPGTTSGNAIADHQPPTRLNSASQQQRFFPHCDSCSRTQAGQVTQEIRRREGN